MTRKHDKLSQNVAKKTGLTKKTLEENLPMCKSFIISTQDV